MPRNILEIPEKGISREDTLKKLKHEIKKDDISPLKGKAFGLSYIESQEHIEFLKEVYCTFFSDNALNPMAYPSLRKMESEVVAMTNWMLHGTRKCTGTMTSGGTESILMAVKSHRDWAREKKDINKPEMILPETAHPAFHKAAHYFDVMVRTIPIREDYRVNIDNVKESITGNTILLVGSAPCYPYGVIDPIEELATVAKENEIGCHVDACLGGFLLPWVEKLGFPLYCKWDFRVPGVTSISADLHKYGYAAKPASTILYQSDEFRKYQFYIYSDWCGGIYGSPSMPGTRPGGSIAAAWASLMALGQKGYLDATKITMKTAKKFCKGINSIEELHVIGEPDAAIYAYTVDENSGLNLFSLIDLMESKGWLINRMQNPPAAHHMTSKMHEPIVSEFLSDLSWAVEKLKSLPTTEKIEGQAAMYGMMGTIKDKGKMNDIVRDILLNNYTYNPKRTN